MLVRLQLHNIYIGLRVQVVGNSYFGILVG